MVFNRGSTVYIKLRCPSRFYGKTVGSWNYQCANPSIIVQLHDQGPSISIMSSQMQVSQVLVFSLYSIVSQILGRLVNRNIWWVGPNAQKYWKPHEMYTPRFLGVSKVKWFKQESTDRQSNGQTYEWALPNAWSPCFLVDKNITCFIAFYLLFRDLMKKWGKSSQNVVLSLLWWEEFSTKCEWSSTVPARG